MADQAVQALRTPNIGGQKMGDGANSQSNDGGRIFLCAAGKENPGFCWK
jgi:hypothetical protein